VISLGTRYDLLNSAIFLPSGGSRRVRRALVEALDIRPGHRVLELGCGTGQVTAELLAAGADVTALDALPEMLVAARRRAPAATFVQGDANESDLGTGHDRAVVSFVLHNLDAAGRAALLRRATDSLGAGGRIGILDWCSPRNRVAARAWRAFLGWLEPSATVTEVLDGAIAADADRAGLRVEARHTVANGRAEVIVLTDRLAPP
jgi:ubiquinone/menaquinone biosynthesis C-methylase UbiE